MKKIGLINDTIDEKDIDELIEWLKTYPRLTKGELTLQLEKEWAKYIGTDYSVFVNSGSSANLLILYALSQLNLHSSHGKFYNTKTFESKPAKILVPAVAWSTDLAPVMQLGFEPILVDCNMNDLSIDIKHLNKLLMEHKDIVAMILVSPLGLVPDSREISHIALHNNFDLIEDNCESMGSEYDGHKLGTFGIASTFSTYFGHHISTIEGGFINTSRKEVYEMLLMLRSHGWDRDLPQETQQNIRDSWKVDDFDSLYTFYVPFVYIITGK